MSDYESNRYNPLSESGVFLLDPEERALLNKCADAYGEQEHEVDAHRRFLKIARELPAVRLQKVMEIRRQIARGEYLTSDKLQGTISRLLEAMN